MFQIVESKSAHHIRDIERPRAPVQRPALKPYEVAEGIRMRMDGVSTRKSNIYSLTLSGICSISSSRSSLTVSFALHCNSGLQVRGIEPAGTPELPLRRHSASCVPA